MSVADKILGSIFPSAKPQKEEEVVLPVSDKSKEIPPNREVLLSWESPSRAYKPRTKEYFKKVVALIFGVSVLLVLAGQFLLIGLIVSVAVLFYVLSSVPPGTVKHEIDNYGVFYLGKQYYWSDFKFFFFTQDGGHDILCIDTKEPYPGRLYMLLDGIGVEKVKEILGKYLPMRAEPPQTIFDKALKGISNKLAL